MDSQQTAPLQTPQPQPTLPPEPIQPTNEIPVKKRIFDIDLKPKWPIRIIAVSLIVPTFFIASTYALISLLSSSCDPNNFGCSIGSFLIGGAISGVLLVIVNVTLLRILVLRRITSSVLVSIPSLVLMGALLYTGTTINVWPQLQNSSIIVSSSATVMLLALAHASMTIFVVWLFRITNKLHWALSVIIALALAVGSYYLVKYESQRLRVSGYNTEVRKDTEKLTFKLFAPTYLPTGYRAYQVNANNFIPPPYLGLDYLYGQNDINDPRPYTIYQFATPKDYNPPTDCGGYIPDNGGYARIANKCDKIGQSSIGCEVFYSVDKNVSDASAYCSHDGTLIVIHTDPFGTFLQPPEIMKLYDSMKLVTASEIQGLVKNQ